MREYTMTRGGNSLAAASGNPRAMRRTMHFGVEMFVKENGLSAVGESKAGLLRGGI